MWKYFAGLWNKHWKGTTKTPVCTLTINFVQVSLVRYCCYTIQINIKVVPLQVGYPHIDYSKLHWHCIMNPLCQSAVHLSLFTVRINW